MKILMLVNWKIEYAKEIPTDRQAPDYYVRGEKYWFFRYFKDKNVEVDVVDIKSFPFLEHFEKEKLRFYIYQTLRVIPRLNKYDMVLSHGMQSGIVLCLIRRIFGKGRYKHIVFDIGAFNSARKEGRALKLMQFASKSLDGVIFHTESQKEYYRDCHPWLLDKSKYIVFGTDTDFFVNKNSSMDETENNETQLGNAAESDYILCSGYHQRDWKTLINAYALTSQKLKLKLLGNPDISIEEYLNEDIKRILLKEDEQSLVRLKNNIIILNHVNINEFKEQILDSYFCVLPLENHNYSFGQMTLLQQMAMGKAVLVAEVPSVKAYLDSKYNVSYISGNIEDLREKLELLMNNAELVSEVGKAAPIAVRNSFNEEKMALSIEEFLYGRC